MLAEEAGQRSVDAKTTEERDHYRKERQKFLKESAANFQKVAEEPPPGRRKARSAPRDELRGRQALFAVAECRFDLGDFKDCAAAV